MRVSPSRCAGGRLPSILLHQIELLINQPLLSLDVSEHVFAFGQADKVGEDLRVLLVKLAQLGQAHLAFCLALVRALQELVDVVEDEVVLEDTDHVGLLVVDQVVDDFEIFKFNVTIRILAPQVAHDKVLGWNGPLLFVVNVVAD